jgi:ubiquitin-protein ligase
VNVRIRRLEGDWAALQAALENHPLIKLAGTAGNPPQRYHFLYKVKGLEEKPDGSIAPKNEHLVEISLLRSYPRQAPACRMLTPVFHPNIAPRAICIGDQWSAGESLVQLVFRIGEMIAFQSYNIKSPLNGVAAKWVEENLSRLPIDPSPFHVGASAAEAGPSPVQSACARCGRLSRPADAWSCPNGHTVCPRCRTLCLGCGGFACSVCGPRFCAVCAQRYCANCVDACHICGRLSCAACSTACQVCGNRTCRDHAGVCLQCRRIACTRDYSPQTGRCAVCEGVR